MEFWLDTCDKNRIQQAQELGFLHGVTTNPTSVADSKKPLELLLKELQLWQHGLVCVQVVGTDVETMLKEAKALYKFSNRFIIKVPVTRMGIEVISKLSREYIPVLATAIYTPVQALMAFKVGANYIAPYIGKIQKHTGEDPFEVLEEIMAIQKRYEFQGKILAAGIKDLTQFQRSLKLGVDAITVPDKVYDLLVTDNEGTLASLEGFLISWQEAARSQLLHDI